MSWIKSGGEGQNAAFTTQVTADIASVAAASVASTNLTVAGVEAGDLVYACPKTALSVAVMVGAAVATAADTVAMPVCNPTAGALDPASQDFEVLCVKPLATRLS